MGEREFGLPNPEQPGTLMRKKEAMPVVERRNRTGASNQRRARDEIGGSMGVGSTDPHCDKTARPNGGRDRSCNGLPEKIGDGGDRLKAAGRASVRTGVRIIMRRGSKRIQGEEVEVEDEREHGPSEQPAADGEGGSACRWPQLNRGNETFNFYTDEIQRAREEEDSHSCCWIRPSQQPVSHPPRFLHETTS
ncbi:hypothetical protein BJX63DRAFT_18627 [Aspergillus granulosus]|uniref:Uncharacterized protein n=1 Tax=Aspergillus granulosus TaxID=176169 RepID=A0ABR4H016_9EURO